MNEQSLYWIGWVLSQLRGGKMVKLTAAQHRQKLETIEQQLRGWGPVVEAAAAYFDALTSELPTETEHAALIEAIRNSGAV